MKLFWRIFLSFWLATILMVAALPVVMEFLPFTLPGDRGRSFQPEVAASVLTAAVNEYERQGPAVFLSHVTIHHTSLYLFDEEGKVLVKDGVGLPFHRQMAEDVLRSSRSELSRLGSHLAFACPIQSATGRPYAVVLSIISPENRLLRPRFWFNITVAMLPAAIVCMVLSLYITHPITKLRECAQRLAGGNLDARASPQGIARRDELGDLARDFDIMAAQIQSLMTSQRRFVADVSHELGAPLTRMHLALALLRRRFRQDIGELGRLERETDKLSSLVQQLLLLARLEAGSRPAENLAPVAMRSLCDSIIEDANFEAAHANCVITGSHEDITILVYPQLFRRAVDNVLRNAIRYAPPGTEVLLDCRIDRELQCMIIEILDRGPGVPETMLTDIFRPFFRTAPGRDSRSGGTGLGLAIASEAIHLHDGTISAENRKDGGLRVVLTLPLRLPTPRNELLPTVSAP
jgi:two-component system sensor histidine kinase CpxA